MNAKLYLFWFFLDVIINSDFKSENLSCEQKQLFVGKWKGPSYNSGWVFADIFVFNLLNS